jgi:hypothetical protein
LQEHDAIVNVAVLCAHLLHTSGRRDLRRPSNDPNWPINDPDLDNLLATMLLPSPRSSNFAQASPENRPNLTQTSAEIRPEFSQTSAGIQPNFSQISVEAKFAKAKFGKEILAQFQ